MMKEVIEVADDLVFAQDLQLEEVLRFSAQPATSCAVCTKVIPSLDASWKPDNCNHAMCISCFAQHASKTHATELPKCPVASCQSLLKPETHRGINVSDGIVILISDDETTGSAKGKEPAHGMLWERGECSRGATTTIIICDSDSDSDSDSEFYCTICMETVDAKARFAMAGCTHAFCVSCTSQYIAAKVEENVLSIGCPVHGCKDGSPLHPEACRDVIPPRLFQRWGDALCDSALSALKFYCPFKDCSALLVDDGETEIKDAECPHCCRMFCAQCKVPWHDGATCEEYQRLGKDERGREDLLLRKVAKESKWQRCPNCKMYVERAEGCVFIICRCGHCFCYLCGSPMSRQSHHCSKCNRTW
ncbi:hypothetical protein GUJ93_ZPchr0009g1346 [Zizania palustris]|uniref:RBR-type E3 ubiquitin transferase n=1 Tax=Zizania palustris TaxID=103762 RepID=A0A8J5RRH0_ZIZPA|nr:hypothetical protein GUJ93_ZPchr0009g1346 [Zizania palustris]